MLNRRTFLTSTAATALMAGGVYAREQEAPAINKTLRSVIDTLRELSVVSDVEDRLVDEPEQGLVQWQWAHFRPDINEELFPQVEEVNGNLLPAMQAVRALPDAGLDELMHEGLVEGHTSRQIAEYARVQRELIRTQFTSVIPFSGTDIPPTPEVMNRELNVLKNLQTPVNQIVYPYGRARHVRLTPLARLGAGYVLSTQKKVTLLTAEDPALDARAERAERSGDPDEFRIWVMEKRDAHFTKLIAESRRPIVHLLVGFGHDLTDDLAAQKKKISHIVVRVKGLAKEGA